MHHSGERAGTLAGGAIAIKVSDPSGAILANGRFRGRSGFQPAHAAGPSLEGPLLESDHDASADANLMRAAGPARSPVLATATWSVTPADLTAAQRLMMRRRYLRPAALIELLVLAAFAVTITLATVASSLLVAIVAPTIGVFVFVAVFLALIYAVMPLYARRAYRAQPGLRHVWSVELSATGLRAFTPHQDNFVAWADYIAWSADPRIVLVYQSDRLIQFIPARALDAEARAVFEDLVSGLPRR